MISNLLRSESRSRLGDSLRVINAFSGKLANILSSLRSGLEQLLGDKLEAVYLYGSHARGDEKPGSDIDVLVVLGENFDYGEILDLTSDLGWKLSLENDVVVSLVFVEKEQFDQVNSPFLLNIRREAIPISA